MTPLEIATLLVRADIATGKATKRSLGAIYAFAISTANDGGAGPIAGDMESDAWASLNTAVISAHPGSATTGASSNEAHCYLDAVKRIGWEIHDAAGMAWRVQ